MAIKNKKMYSVYLDEESVTIIQNFLENKKGSGGFSALMDEYVMKMAKTLRDSDLKDGEKVTFSKCFKLIVNGFKNSP